MSLYDIFTTACNACTLRGFVIWIIAGLKLIADKTTGFDILNRG